MVMEMSNVGAMSDIIDRARRSIAPSQSNCEMDFVLSKAKGTVLEDIQGKRYLDFFSGIAVCNVGHCHPKVAGAIKAQVDKSLHACLSGYFFLQQPMIALAEKLKEIGPLKEGKVFFCSSGADTVEGGLKVARLYSKKLGIISYMGSFHGRTLGATSVTASNSKYRRLQTPLLGGVTHVPFPYCYRCAFGKEYPDCDVFCFGFIDRTLESVMFPEDVAAVLIEPIQGEAGYVPPPDEYMHRLRKLCTDRGFLLMMDEIQTGFGRTGKMFACEHTNTVPDIMLMSKAIAAGLPLGAIVARPEIMDTFIPHTHAGTFNGNPICCSAALASIEVIQGERLVENAAKVGSFIMKRLGEMQDKIPVIGDIRGKGLMVGVELVEDKKSKKPLVEESRKITPEAAKRGLALITTGVYGHVVRIAPALVLTEQEADRGLHIIEEVLKELK